MKLKKPTTPAKQEKNVSGAEAFISEAETRGIHKQSAFPWEEADPKQTKAFNLRLPLDMYEKLRYLGENTPRTSMNNICIDGLEPHIEELLSKLLKKG